MVVSRKSVRVVALAAVAALGVNELLATYAQAAVLTKNFDVNGATAGFGVVTGTTYDWDSTANGGLWSDNATSATGNIATTGWLQGSFPKFQPASTPTYIVTVSNSEQVAGMFFSTAQNLTINAIGSGELNMVAGLQGVLGSASADVTINAPINGPGEPQFTNGGNIRLDGVNGYTGGTNLDSTSTLVHFNNNSSFGTNFINMGIAGLDPILASGGTTITLPNNFTSSVVGAGINWAADANTPVVTTGSWTLGGNSMPLRNNGDVNSPLTLSGKITGTATGTILLSTNTAGVGATIKFSNAANTYVGSTTITGPGGTGAGSGVTRLLLGATNEIATSSSVILAGGILDPGGFTQSMAGTLGLTTSTNPSVITYASGNTEVDFANSSALTWVGTLNLTNWTTGVTLLRFGTTSSGLTPTQLGDIEFNGASKGAGHLTSTGYLVPEPTTAALLLLGAPMLASRRRRMR